MSQSETLEQYYSKRHVRKLQNVIRRLERNEVCDLDWELMLGHFLMAYSTFLYMPLDFRAEAKQVGELIWKRHYNAVLPALKTLLEKAEAIAWPQPEYV